MDIHARAVRARIEDWLRSGLIDGATADRLLRRERERGDRSFPILMASGALAIALGIVALVAANWEEIPPMLRLGAHAALNPLLAVAAWMALMREGRGARTCEVLVTVLSASLLAFLAHAGQAFQLQGDELGMMAAWLALVTPFTLLAARGAANRTLWTAGLLVTAVLAFDAYEDFLADRHLASSAVFLFLAVLHGAPAWLRGGTAVWGRHLGEVGLALVVGLAAAAQFVWQGGFVGGAASAGDLALGGGAGAIAFAAARIAVHGRAGWRSWTTVLASAAPVVAVLPLLAEGSVRSDIASTAAFCLWSGFVAIAARSGGRPDIVRFAAWAVALRLVAFFLVAMGGLLATATGLLLGGAVALAAGFAARRWMRSFAS